MQRIRVHFHNGLPFGVKFGCTPPPPSRKGEEEEGVCVGGGGGDPETLFFANCDGPGGCILGFTTMFQHLRLL